jgi:DNA polymerase I-like protein with 3'-5' exonuclease and polymerase domains
MERYDIIDTAGKLKTLAQKMSKLDEFAFDTETTTLRVYGYNKDFKGVGISISWGFYNNYYIPLCHEREEDWERNIPLKVLRQYLRPVFEREDVRIIGHNLKFDMHVMARLGIDIKTKDLYDTMIACWLCNENIPKGLKENSMLKLGIKQEHFAEVINNVPKEVKKSFGLKASQKATFNMVLIDEGAPYALADAFYTWCLYLGTMDEMAKEGMDKIFNKTYKRFLRTLFVMEEHGTQVDTERLEQMKVDVKADKEDLLYDIYELAGCEFNVNSNAQIQELLFGYQKPITHPTETNAWKSSDDKKRQKLMQTYDKAVSEQEHSRLKHLSFNFKVISRTPSGAPQANTAVLLKLCKQTFKVKRKQEGVELCRKLLAYKKLEKLSSAFMEGLSEQLYSDGKAHPSFNILGTDSGRISCSSPNLQQLPKAEDDDKYQIRSLFIGSEYVADKNGDWVRDYTGGAVEKGCTVKRKKIIAGDYNNLEMRVLTHYCIQRNMPIALADGGSREIGTLVQKCEPVYVKSYNFETGKIQNMPVSDFWKNGKSALYDKPQYRGEFKDWLRITNDGDDSRLIVTHNHSIFTTEGKKLARDLKVGDTIYYNAPCIENDLKDLVIGMSLGDSNFVKRSDNLTFYHSQKQYDYLMWKYRLLKDFVTGTIQEEGKMHKAIIGANPFIRKLKRYFTNSDGKKHKQINAELLSSLNLKSLAIWYLDDGCLGHDNRCSDTKGYYVTIARENLSDEAFKVLSDKFNEYNLKFNRIKGGISCSGDNALNFLNAIAPYTPKCMAYKFPKFLQDSLETYQWNVEHKDVTEVKIISIEQVKEGDRLFSKSLTQSGYDLEVPVNHNYFANNILVSNSKDTNLMNMFLSGSDTHSSTAVNMFELDCPIEDVKKKYPHLRQAAKVINFLLMYGGGAYTLYNNLKDDPYSPIDLSGKEYLEKYHVKTGEEVAQAYIDKYFEAYSGITTFMQKQKRFAHKNGYVQTLLRRKRRLPDINSHDFKAKAYCERLSVNSCIQGSAADITMSAQNRINADPWFKSVGADMILQIHDEVVFECPEKYVDDCIAKAKAYMEHPFGDNVELNLPMLTAWDSGDSYQEAK